MKTWLALPRENQAEILTRASENLGVDAKIIEKDLWVSAVLKVLFEGPYQGALAFKGGTSLSKAWGLIQRFSEDVDISFFDIRILPREVDGKAQLDKFRRDARRFFTGEFAPELKRSLEILCGGSEAFELQVQKAENSDQDPTVIFIHYLSAVADLGVEALRKDQVQIEVSGRSEVEPAEMRTITSMLSEGTKGSFGLPQVVVRAIHPRRTFLEKCFLLHEEFSRNPPREDIRAERLSRHLYDISRLMEAPEIRYDAELVKLFSAIAQHRKKFTKVGGVDYDTISLASLVLQPPKQSRAAWEADYHATCETLITGETPSFDELLVSLQALKQRFSELIGSPS